MSNTALFLHVNGWKEYPNQFKDQARCFYKRFKTPTRCKCNDKPGMQVELTVSTWKGGPESYELELNGELGDETWVKLMNYALPNDIESVLKLIPRLVAIWEAAAKPYQTTPTP
jgi:hypothetical protein